MERIAARRSARMLLAGGVLALLAQFPGQAAAQNCIRGVNPGTGGAQVLPADRCGVTFDLAVPTSCPEAGCGLIVELPGVTLNSEIQNRNNRIRDLGVQAGFVVAQATANPGAAGLPSFAAGDERSLERFVREAVRELDIDPKRVHFTGFSQGGGLSLRLACSLPNLIASVAVLAPAGGGMVPASCSASGLPVPGVLMAQSIRDQLVPAMSTLRTVEAFVSGMGLDFERGGQLLAETQDSFLERFVNQERRQVLEFFLFSAGGATIGDGHCFPGSFEGPQPGRNLEPAVRTAALQLFRTMIAGGAGRAMPAAMPMGMGAAAMPGMVPAPAVAAAMTSTDPNIARLTELLSQPEQARRFVQDLQFACNDNRQIRFGEQVVRFFRENPRP